MGGLFEFPLYVIVGCPNCAVELCSTSYDATGKRHLGTRPINGISSSHLMIINFSDSKKLSQQLVSCLPDIHRVCPNPCRFNLLCRQIVGNCFEVMSKNIFEPLGVGHEIVARNQAVNFDGMRFLVPGVPAKEPWLPGHRTSKRNDGNSESNLSAVRVCSQA